MRIACSLLMIAMAAAAQGSEGPYLGTGFKVGEVNQDSAVVWVRTTATRERVPESAPFPIVKYIDPATGDLVDNGRPKNQPERKPVVSYPAGFSIETIEGAVPGAPGQVMVRVRPEGAAEWRDTPWRATVPERDHTIQIMLLGLAPGTRHELEVQCRPREGAPSDTRRGGFTTAPAKDQAVPVRFTVSTGQRYSRMDVPGGGFRIYDTMLRNPPDFFVHTGDIVYYDEHAKNTALARWHWQRTYSLPTNLRFHQQVASYFIKDDHDTWRNDCWPSMESPMMGEFTFEQGLAVFREQTPIRDRTYRTYRWGPDLQIWLVEGRDFRSPNTMPDGPGKTIWGKEQMAWFKQTAAESDAAFRVLISPTPVVGPDRLGKADNHANAAFRHEGAALREFMAGQGNMVSVCGDRHWQYVSVDQDTGLREYSCGPATNKHAGGWSNDQVLPEHVYLNVTGGYLEIEVVRRDGVPTLCARHHGVEGNLLNQECVQVRDGAIAVVE